MKWLKNKLIAFSLLVLACIGVAFISKEMNLLDAAGSLDSLSRSTGELTEDSSVFMFVIIEAFVTIHMSVFVLWPLSHIIGKEKHNSVFKMLFVGRIIILALGDMANPAFTMMVDFIAVFVGAFLVVPLFGLISKVPVFGSNQINVDVKRDALEPLNDLNHLGMDIVSVKKELVVHFASVNDAFDSWDSNKLKSLCSPGIYTNYKNERESLDKKSYRKVLDNVDFYSVEIYSAEKYGNEIFIKLLVKYTCLEYIVDNNQNIINGSMTEYKDYTKELLFSKKIANKTALFCPSCGAPIDNKEKRCGYCNRVLNYRVGDWVLKSINLISEGKKGE